MDVHRYGDVHPTPACSEFMRRELLEELDGLYHEAPKLKHWRLLTADAGEPFPTADMIRKENYGEWHDAVMEQVRNASNPQIDAYWHERFPECPVCGASW